MLHEKPPHAMKGKVEESVFTFFSPYICLFKDNNNCHPSLQVECHRGGTTAIVVKGKEEGWGSRPAVTWECPRPVHAFATHKRANTDDTKEGREKDKGMQRKEDNRAGNARALICHSFIHHFSPGLLMRIGVTCIRKGSIIMRAVQASASFLLVSEVAGCAHLSAPNGL